jgi:hypothetical protein
MYMGYIYIYTYIYIERDGRESAQRDVTRTERGERGGAESGEREGPERREESERFKGCESTHRRG